jgi:hypothetical protein
MRWLVVVLFAACGSHPVDLGDGAADVGIGCNQPQPLLGGTAAIPRLAAAASGSHIAVGWTTDDATLGSARISLAGDDHIAAVERDAYATPGVFTGVSIAMTADATLVALGTQDGHTQLVTQGGAPIMTTVQLDAPGAATLTGATPAFALAGNDTAAGTAAMIGSDGTGSVPIGSNAARLVATRIKDGLAIVEVLSSNTCALVPIDIALTRAGAPIPFGAKKSVCTQAAAAYNETTGETLLVRRDGDSGAIKSTLVHADRTLTAETTTAPMGSEPRTIATATGTWVSYANAGMLEVALVDATGTPTKTIELGAVADATGHALVSTGTAAYALWMADDLKIARLCP